MSASPYTIYTCTPTPQLLLQLAIQPHNLLCSSRSTRFLTTMPPTTRNGSNTTSGSPATSRNKPPTHAAAQTLPKTRKIPGGAMILGAAILTGEAVVDPDKPKSTAFDVKFWVRKDVRMPITARLR